MSNAVIYARVSSKEQADEGFSIPAQLKLLREYAEHHDLEVAQEFVDVETAKRAGRQAFTEVVDFLKRRRKTCGVLLVEKTDRLYRNLRDYVTLDELDLEVHFVKEGFVLSEGSRSMEKFMHGIKVLMAKQYVDNLSEEASKGMREKAEQGTWPSFAPLGYVNVQTNGERKVDLDPERAPVIRRMFEWYAAGSTSLTGLQRRAIEAGFTTRRGRPPTRSIISSILKNPFYTGVFLWDGKLLQGDHSPIVSPDLFERTQQAFRKDGKPLTKPQQTFAYTGLITCAHCGCAVTAERKKGRYVYHHCTGGRGECARPYVREERLEGLLGEAVRAVAIDERTVDWITTALKESHREEREFRSSQVAALEREAARVQDRLDAMYEDKLDGKITEDLWERKSSEWRRRQLEVRATIDRHERASHRYFDEGVRVLQLAQRAYGLWTQQPPEQKRKLLDVLLSNCTFDGGSLDVTYRKPFCWLAEERRCSDWLPAPGPIHITNTGAGSAEGRELVAELHRTSCLCCRAHSDPSVPRWPDPGPDRRPNRPRWPDQCHP